MDPDNQNACSVDVHVICVCFVHTELQSELFAARLTEFGHMIIRASLRE